MHKYKGCEFPSLPCMIPKKFSSIVMLLQRTLAQLQNGKGFSFEIKNRLFSIPLAHVLEETDRFRIAYEVFNPSSECSSKYWQ